jgi:tetratricopeptide (TPR) repeat protein
MRSATQQPLDMFSTAVAHHQAGRLQEAEKAYLEVLKTDPRNSDAMRLLGSLYIQTSQIGLAVDYLERALQVQPRNIEIMNNLGVALRNQGKLDEATKQFERAIGIKPDYVSALRNLAGTLADIGSVLYAQNRLNEAVSLYEHALSIMPDYFAALCNLGNVRQAQGKAAEAIACYVRAEKLKPDSPELYVNLGAAYWDLNQLNKAVECYEQALRLRPNYVEALVNYGTALWGQGKPDEAAAKYAEVLRLKPDHIEALTCLGALRHDKNLFDEALAMYESALRIKPDYPDALWRKSLILLASGQYREGWALYEKGLGKRTLRGLNRFSTLPWDGTANPATRLLICGEQGLGDSLQFIRYANLCKQRVGKVLVLCPKPLVRLFKSCPFIDEASDSFSETDFDQHVAMMSLPHLFETELETVPAAIPYLHVEPSAEEKWAQKLSCLTGLKVGLVWAGNAREGQINAHATDRRRSLSLDQLKPLFSVKNISFVSLQMGKPAAQIDSFGLRPRIIDFMDEVEDFMDTAAIIQSLDLVISVDTSVAHLAGALGKSVWVLSRYDACWRWLGNRENNPWYPTARIFGQTHFGAWDGVIERVCDSLAALPLSS